MPNTKKYLRELVQIHKNDTEYYYSHGWSVYKVVSHTVDNGLPNITLQANPTYHCR